MENVNRHGSRRNRILESERAIDIALLVMSVKMHSIAFLRHVRILLERRPLPLHGAAPSLMGQP